MYLSSIDLNVCVVISGSHNLGYRSSYNNDENLVIIRGNREVAQSYAVHTMGVYDHYRWRFMLKQDMHGNWTDHDWQNPYFTEDGELQNELKFLTSVFK